MKFLLWKKRSVAGSTIGPALERVVAATAVDMSKCVSALCKANNNSSWASINVKVRGFFLPFLRATATSLVIQLDVDSK